MFCKTTRKKEFYRAVVEWDTINWAAAVDFWHINARLRSQTLNILEIGARNGGLSLLFAKLNNSDKTTITCSDLNSPKDNAQVLHHQFNVEQKITYKALNALDLNETNVYDIICFKSVLGGIGHDDNPEAQKKAICNIYRALKPGGYLLFAENLIASRLHQLLRKRFVPWGSSWRYVSIAEILLFCNMFSHIEYKCLGFLGAFGRTEKQRCILGLIDRYFDRFLPDNMKYIISVAAQKTAGKIS